MVKLIVMDLDNTLLNSKKEITDYTAQVLLRCQEKGIKLAFATARSNRVIKQYQLKVNIDYLISNNGAVIYEKAKKIKDQNIFNQTMNNLIKELLGHSEVERIWVDVGTHTYINVEEGIPAHWKALDVVYNDLSTDLSENSSKISVRCTDPKLMISIISNYPDLRLYANSGEEWYQINHVTATKMNGVNYLSDILNINLSEVLAFGDDYNDIEMLKGCGMGVAMENAADEVKNTANQICGSNNDDGVAKWIEKNLL